MPRQEHAQARSALAAAAFLALVGAGSASSALTPPPDHGSSTARVAEALFPETRDWPDIGPYPEATAADLVLARRIAEAQKDNPYVDDTDCSPFRSLDDPAPARRPAFRKGRIMGDDRESLIFYGPSRCSAGTWSSIWGDLRDTSHTNEFRLGEVLLRLMPAKDGKSRPRVLVADTWDGTSAREEYALITLGERRERRIATRRGLALPKGASRVERDLTAKADTKLQAKPDAAEVDPPENSFDLNHAKGGERLRQIMAWRDGGGTAWSLVVRTVHNPSWGFDETEAGWILASAASVDARGNRAPVPCRDCPPGRSRK